MSIGQKHFLALFLTIFSLVLPTAAPSVAREQYEIPRPAGPPPQGPNMGHNYPQALGLVPALPANFWQTQYNQCVPVGTVLGAVLQEDISSKGSHIGDVFQLVLTDGFTQNGTVLIPPQSRILGKVTAVMPAGALANGQPGRIDVSLQTLVFPDGKTLPFQGFIAHNINHDPKDEAKVVQSGTSLKHYGTMVGSFFGQFTRGVGAVHNQYNRGLDFSLKKGELVPVRLTAAIELPKALPPIGYQQPSKAISIPGLVGPDPEAQLLSPVRSINPQTGLVAHPGALMEPAKDDPNACFNQPITGQRAPDVADPF